MGDSVALIRARCQDALLSEKAVCEICCTTIWILKRKICLYVIEIFWKDTKGTVNSGMPLKKDTRDWRSGRGKEIYFSLYSFLCFLKKSFFFLLCACIIFSIKKKVGGWFKNKQIPRLFLVSQATFSSLPAARSCRPDSQAASQLHAHPSPSIHYHLSQVLKTYLFALKYKCL